MTWLLALIFILLASPAWAACTGASPTWTSTADYASVSACVTNASNGDTINVSAGSATWSSSLVVTKFLRIIGSAAAPPSGTCSPSNTAACGAGASSTHITNNLTTANLIDITESTSGSTRIEGFEFIQGTGPGVFFHIFIHGAAGGRPVIVYNNTWTNPMGGDAIRAATNKGVIAHNSFDSTSDLSSGPFHNSCANQHAALRHYNVGTLAEWQTPPVYGLNDAPNGDRNLYFESNYLKNVFQGVDVAFNGREVFRNNRVINSGFLHHGADTGAIGARYTEVYNNSFEYDGTLQPTCPDSASGTFPAAVTSLIYFRGGTGLVWGNAIPNVSTQAWGDIGEVHLIEEAIRRNSSDWHCWPTGANYQQTSAYPAPMQVGWGFSTGGTFVGVDPTNGASLSMDLEPLWIFSNTGTGDYNAPRIDDYSPPDCNAGDSSSNYIHAGIEYRFTAPPSGAPYGLGPGIPYAPFTYPHPLIGGGGPTPPGTPANLTVS